MGECRVWAVGAMGGECRVWAVGAMGGVQSVGGESYGGVQSVGGGALQQLLFASCGTELLDPCAPSLSYIPSQNSTTWTLLNIEDFAYGHVNASYICSDGRVQKDKTDFS